VAKFNCNTESIVHKKYVPPGYVVNVKFYCNWLLNNRHIRPENWRNDSWAQIHDKAKAPASLVVSALFGFYEYDSHPTLSLLTAQRPLRFFPIPEDEI
jgi:hypothetical protein